jgi:hypothetical protein
MRIRVRTAVIMWLIGAAGLFLYPPMQGVAQVYSVGPGSRVSIELGTPLSEFAFDAQTARWRWTMSDHHGSGWPPYTYGVHEARLLAQIGLWTAFVAAGAFVGGRVARWPGPAGTTLRWAALLAAGFASANVGLALLLADPDLVKFGRLAGNGKWGRAAELAWDDLFCWGYGFVLPYAAVVWGMAALVGYLRRQDGGAPRDWTKHGSLDWAKGTQQWPREHWLGGPAKR